MMKLQRVVEVGCRWKEGYREAEEFKWGGE